MARISADSGGVALLGDAPGEIVRQFEQHMARVRPPRVERSIAWDRWWIFAAALALWGTSWGLRRMSGLV